MTRKSIVIVAVLVALAAGAWFFFSPSGGSVNAGFTVTADDRTLGDPKAKLVLIEYFAPSCPVCAAFNARTFPALKQNYIDTGKVFYVMRVYPIRADDGTAEKIARCLPPAQYKPFIDILFQDQMKWDIEFNQSFTPMDVHDALVAESRNAGLSAEQADICIKNPTEDARINTVAMDGEARYHITGTPTLVLNGTPVGGFMPYDNLKKVLDAALAGAKPTPQ